MRLRGWRRGQSTEECPQAAVERHRRGACARGLSHPDPYGTIRDWSTGPPSLPAVSAAEPTTPARRSLEAKAGLARLPRRLRGRRQPSRHPHAWPGRQARAEAEALPAGRREEAM